MSVKDILIRVAKDSNVSVKKKLGSGVGNYNLVLTGDEVCLSDRRIVVPTRSILLNKLLGGGIVPGRVYEIYGPWSSGKTTLAQEIMIAFQEYPGISIMLDAERTWDRNRAVEMGHNPDRHMHIETNTVEHGVETIDTVVTNMRMPGKGLKLDIPIVVVWDTLSNTGTVADLEGDFSGGMMNKPRKLRDLERKWSDFLPRMNVALVFISQTHIKPAPKGSNKRPTTQTDGGGAVKFWASQRLELYREANSVINYPYKNCGFIMCVKTVKDKFNPPMQTVYLPMVYKTGLSSDYDIVNFLLDNDKKKEYVYKDGNDLMVVDWITEDDKKFDLAINLKQIPKMFLQVEGLRDYLIAAVDDIWQRINY